MAWVRLHQHLLAGLLRAVVRVLHQRRLMLTAHHWLSSFREHVAASSRRRVIAHALVLLRLFRAQLQPSRVIFKLHLPVELLSFLEDLHKFAVDFVAAESFKNVLLVLELVLGLLRLLSALLLLDLGECVLWLVGLSDVLPV